MEPGIRDQARTREETFMLTRRVFAACGLCAAAGTLKLAAGDGFRVPTGVPHGGVNGPAKTVIISTYLIEKGKPLALPA
jgi:hypothetical protein